MRWCVLFAVGVTMMAATDNQKEAAGAKAEILVHGGSPSFLRYSQRKNATMLSTARKSPCFASSSLSNNSSAAHLSVRKPSTANLDAKGLAQENMSSPLRKHAKVISPYFSSSPNQTLKRLCPPSSPLPSFAAFAAAVKGDAEEDIIKEKRETMENRSEKKIKTSSGASNTFFRSTGMLKPGERTNSFGPVWCGSAVHQDSGYDPQPYASNFEMVHTLILGTHPSIASLTESQYFGHPMNAFWWIAGDCLNFRRSSGVSPSSKQPYKFTSSLRHGVHCVVPYEEQVRILTSYGFALWDLISSCQREGSLDSNIKAEETNDILGFCWRHVGVRRIVFSNGSGQSSMFLKHFRDWWKKEGNGDEDEIVCGVGITLVPGENEESLKVFKNYADRRRLLHGDNEGLMRKYRLVECISALPVSPAAAKYSYEEKRDHWERYCYDPGMCDYKRKCSTAS